MVGVIYPIVLFCVCFFNWLSCSACIFQMRDKPNQFLIQIKIYFFILYLFFLLIKQLFSQLHYFSPVLKRFRMFFIYFHFNIIYILFWNLHCFLSLVLLVIYFNSYQWAECLRTTLAGFFLGGVHWQWPWTLLRIDPRVLGDVLHSVMFPFLYLFLFLCNILT